MTEGNPNSMPGAPGLNESQARRLSVTCQYIDKLLADIESVPSATLSKAAFPRYSPDIAPAQRRTIEDYIGRIRAQLVRVLEGQGIPREKPQIPASRAIQVMLGAVDISVEELKPKYMRGYGEVPESVARELNGIVGELAALVSRLERYLTAGVGQDLKIRVERLEQAGNDMQLLQNIEQIVRERGLVEFRSAIAAILDRVEDKTFEIAVFGRVSSGKSSLLNAILETDVLPVGVTPITAVPTRISHAEEPSLTVWFSEAPAKTFEVARLQEFATEQQNPGNAKHVTRIVVGLPSPRLRGGVAFVDTPGLGSLATSGAAEALAYLPKCDLGVVLIDAGATPTAEDLQTILTLQESAVPVNVLLSKADLLGFEDRGRIIRYVKEHIASECKMNLPVCPVSILQSCREMTDQWFQSEIVPMYGHSLQLRAASLRRKIGALRESVASALRARLRREHQFSAKSLERIRAAEEVLRKTTGQIEELRTIFDREIARAAAETARGIQWAAGRLLDSWSRNDGGPITPGQVVRNAVAHSVQQQVKKLQDDLSTFAAQLQRDLRQCSSDLNLADAPAEDEFLSLIRGTPVFDPQPFSILLKRPAISGLLGRSFAERRVARSIGRQLGQSFYDALDGYWRQLGEWVRLVVDQIKQRFEIYAENYRAQAERALGGKELNADEPDAIRKDLQQLGAEFMPANEVTATARADLPDVGEMKSKTAKNSEERIKSAL